MTKNNCIKRLSSTNYLNHYIIFKEEDILNEETIESKFNKLLTNELTTCKKCRYNKKGEVIDIKNPNYFRLINKINLPKIFFVVYDFLNENDERTEEELEEIEFYRRKQYNDLLLNLLKDRITYENKIYILKSFIFTQQSDHLTTTLLNYQNELLNLKNQTNYFYNDDIKNHILKEIDNLNRIFKENFGYQ